MIIFWFIFLLVLLAVLILIFTLIYKIRQFLQQGFNTTNIKDIIKQTELEEETRPKTLYGMESVYLPILKKDFKELNINELKSYAEKNIIECLTAIKNKDKTFESKSDKVLTWVNEKINNAKENMYENVKIHKTILNRYEKTSSIATLTFQTALEYKINDKKIQSRIETQFIYIIDSDKTENNAIGLNCPNCGAPIKSLGEKQCVYCSAGVVDIVKRVWSLNNIKEI